MTEDSADGAREHDGCDETHAAAAVGALQHIDLEAGPSRVFERVPKPTTSPRHLAFGARTP